MCIRDSMATYVYVASTDGDQISVFSMDAATGKLTPTSEVAASGGPFLLAINPNKEYLYAGHRNVPEISSWRVDQGDGSLSKIGTITPETGPAFMSTDRKGRYLLSSFYQSGHAAVHPIGDDGVVGDPPIEFIATDNGAHAMQTDPSNRFAFVPHIARLNDNVMEPQNDSVGPNVIYQYKFDENTGRLTPNSPAQVEQSERLGPRHYCFHPSLDLSLIHISEPTRPY